MIARLVPPDCHRSREDVLLPRLQPERLADELALGHEANRLDERDDVGRS